MSDNMRMKLKIWRQKGPNSPGAFRDYELDNVWSCICLLEMLDVLNEKLIKEGKKIRLNTITIAVKAFVAPVGLWWMAWRIAPSGVPRPANCICVPSAMAILITLLNSGVQRPFR